MTRTNTKIGDVFSVKLDDNSKKYFQYVANDLTQLNSDVIKVFKKVYDHDAHPDLEGVVNGEAEFYAHCVTKWGIKMNLWEKVGNIPVVCTIDVLFRDTNDYGSKPGEQIDISHNWYTWKINDLEFKRVGRLEGDNQKAEIGIVILPTSIIHRMRTGNYDFRYPGY